MTETPADEYRQAAAELRDVAPMIDGPLAGLADPVADWLDQAAKHHDATVIGAASVWQRPDEAAYRDAFVTKHTDRAALAVARQLLGTTSCGCPHPVDEHSVYGCAEDCACEWMPSRTPAAPPAPADRAAVLAEVDWIVEHCPDHGCVEPETAVCHCEIADRLRRLADGAAAGVQPPTSEARCSYRLEHRRPGETTWQRNTPGIGANWSWQSREKADQRLAEARDRWPDFEHRLIETTTTVTEQPAAPAAPEEPQ